MKENEDFLYEAFQAKDTRFDGRYFVGISSTKIYCRPTCRAKRPKRENCTFFSSAAEAEQAGYRPCLLCRPELAPGNAIIDASSSLAQKAAQLMSEHCGDGQSVTEIAQKLGCTDQHLRRVFFAYTVFTDLPAVAREEFADGYGVIRAGCGHGSGIWEFAPAQRFVSAAISLVADGAAKKCYWRGKAGAWDYRSAGLSSSL